MAAGTIAYFPAEIALGNRSSTPSGGLGVPTGSRDRSRAEPAP
jgi:hypothetical protein